MNALPRTLPSPRRRARLLVASTFVSSGLLLGALQVTAQPVSQPTPLIVPGFQDASHVPPRSSGPQPVVVVLHGNFDRPEWECDIWAPAVRDYGWTLCPRGVRSPGATLQEDRWTYRSRAAIMAELEASLKALEATYPGRVSREGMVLAGFSLGAIHAPEIAVARPGWFRWLFLVEGGLKKLTSARLKALKAAGVRGIGLAMSMPGRRGRAKRLLKKIARADLSAVFVDMEGAGHGYSASFSRDARSAFERLRQDAPPP